MCIPSNWRSSEEEMVCATADFFESALARPVNKCAYGETDLAALAAAYAFGLAKNPPFVDGNKRVAFASVIVFLGMNEVDFDVPPEQATAMIFALAAGEISKENLARWIRDNWPKS
jgi:death-on-curing protein